ncbi:hypothetical protein AB0B85_32765 [Micromonospora sp. NPDC049044]|uniref:hypothetical protein n=1 Tax=Micromonospora sp. NPDC049044 TaxID=3154827 RepID=UPI0033D382F0
MSEPTGPVTYSRRWSFRRHKPIEPMSAQQAAARDAAGEFYTVALRDPSGAAAPDAVIEIAWGNNHVGVWFFDEYGRQALRYSFRRSNDHLFLHGITQWDYPDESAATLSGATRVDKFQFGEDGVAQRLTSNDATRETTKEDRSGVNVSTHWESFPRFGEWASLARWKRGTSVS